MAWKSNNKSIYKKTKNIHQIKYLYARNSKQNINYSEK